MKYSFLIAALTTALLAAGCAGGYSIREHAIRSKIPQEFRNYTNGIIANPTDATVRQAIALGKASKDNDALQYAYLTKAPRSLFNQDSIYIQVATPLQLIANHAREQARDYRKVNDNFVQYARKLSAVRISISQQFISTITWDAYGFQRQIILLRDGVRVEPLLEIPGRAGKNPFAEKPSKEMQATFASIDQTMKQISKGWTANMTKEQKEQVLRSYRAMGLSEDQMAAYTGFSRDEIQEILDTQSNAVDGKISLSEFDAVFPIDELTKPGNYELVFRTPQIASLYARGDKEVRFPISFAGFR